MEKEKRQMIQHINPLYTVAQICAVACIIVLVIGIVITDWDMVMLRWKSRKLRKQYERQKYDWVDPQKWEESNIRQMKIDGSNIVTGKLKAGAFETVRLKNEREN